MTEFYLFKSITDWQVSSKCSCKVGNISIINRRKAHCRSYTCIKKTVFCKIISVCEKNEDYILQLNDKNCTNSKIVQKSDNLYKNIAFKNNWADYYVLSFDDIEDKIVNLVYSDDKGNNITIAFIKE